MLVERGSVEFWQIEGDGRRRLLSLAEKIMPSQVVF